MRYGTCELVQTIQNTIEFIIVLLALIVVLLLVWYGLNLVVSGGNSEALSKIKSYFVNVFVGLLLIMGGYAIVNTIITILVSDDYFSGSWSNVECVYPTVAINIDLLKELREGDGPIAAGGSCEEMTTGDCTTDKLGCFGAAAGQASQICSVESGGLRNARSGTDLCKDGTSFSHGLFQVNIVAHGGRYPGCEAGIIEKRGSGTQGKCIKEVTNSVGVKYCAIRDCNIVRGKESAYDSCLRALQDPAKNIEYACELYADRGGNWKDWEITAGRCSLPAS